jgi:hypothetical protein
MRQDESWKTTMPQDPTGPLGQLYQGQFKGWIKHGIGELHYEVAGVGRFVYEGEFENDKKHGHGVLTWPDGRQYTGHFANDDFHGDSIITWADGNKYVGHYANGKKDGQGTIFYSDGSMCIAHFDKGKRLGQCTYVEADGAKKDMQEVHECSTLQDKINKICEDEGYSLATPESLFKRACMSSEKTADDTSSRRSFASKSTSASSQTTVQSQAPLPETPQRWRVVDYGGVVARATSSFKSRKLGTIPQNEELWVIGAEGRRLKVVNPVEGWSIGWMSASNEEGLILMERVDQMEESERSIRSTMSLKERFFPRAQRSEKSGKSLKDRLRSKLGL